MGKRSNFTIMLAQARLEWVTGHLKLTHYLNEIASAGDATAMSLRATIVKRGHLTETQIRFAKTHIRDLRPTADLDEADSVINEAMGRR